MTFWHWFAILALIFAFLMAMEIIDRRWPKDKKKTDL